MIFTHSAWPQELVTFTFCSFIIFADVYEVCDFSPETKLFQIFKKMDDLFLMIGIVVTLFWFKNLFEITSRKLKWTILVTNHCIRGI